MSLSSNGQVIFEQILNSTALELLRDKEIEVSPLITHVKPFSSAIEAYRLIDRNPQETIKVALSYD